MLWYVLPRFVPPLPAFRRAPEIPHVPHAYLLCLRQPAPEMKGVVVLGPFPTLRITHPFQCL